MGQNSTRTIYDDLELICRDGKRTEMFIGRYQATQPKVKPAPVAQAAGQHQPNKPLSSLEKMALIDELRKQEVAR
jgi:hypothetical protein